MKKFKITGKNFLSWYFNSGSDQEQEAMLRDLGSRALEELEAGNKCTVTTRNLFEETEHGAIRMYFCEGPEEDGELMDIEGGFELELIDADPIEETVECYKCGQEQEDTQRFCVKCLASLQ
tara:strand:+ start:716 stop:1078 length:363 start_codon:yes stop_codon:yes gene_type:complete